MRLHDDYTALLRRVSDLEARLAMLERRDDRRSAATPETVRIVSEVIKTAAIIFGLEPWQIEGNSRTLCISYARQWVMFEARERGLSYPQIGAALGRDHSTVKNGVSEERLRRAKRLPDNENSTKIETGRALRQQPPDPDRNRDLMRRSQDG